MPNAPFGPPRQTLASSHYIIKPYTHVVFLYVRGYAFPTLLSPSCSQMSAFIYFSRLSALHEGQAPSDAGLESSSGFCSAPPCGPTFHLFASLISNHLMMKNTSQTIELSRTHVPSAPPCLPSPQDYVVRYELKRV